MKVVELWNQRKEERVLKKYEKVIHKINEKEAEYETYSDQQLREMTTTFKHDIAKGKTIDELKVDAFAVVREASKRVLGMRPFDVQLIGGLVLLEGNISEMPTGEGKTLVASLPSYLRALEGKGVHVITVNEYLARRDHELIGKIHEFLGLTVGLNVPGLQPNQKKDAYKADITYGIGTEFGFDYLRDNMAYSLEQKVQRPYFYAIVDEIDSVLIDEAKTPLIVAGKTMPSENLHNVCSKLTKSFKEDEHYTFDREVRTVSLTEAGINKIEKTFGISNLYDLEHQSLNHYMMQSLRAHVMFERDVDYIVDKGEIKLVDMYTGRIMEGRSLSDGLHQAIEAKENLKITEENKAQASITVQNYFRMYPILSGMTGTAKTEESEFQHIYNMDVVQIPTNKPIIRQDMPDLVYMTKEQKYKRMVEEVKQRHETGQPILIGTSSILQSEKVAEYLDAEQLPYQLLNAKSVEQEANLISLAGQLNQITIATNMAGRGTDIMLGEGVAELGGLHVLGTERHESRRIDNQLKGRSGRQGDPGSTQFIISMEDDMMNRYAKEDVENKLPSLKTAKDGLVLNKDIQKFIDTIQKISEGSHSQIREYNLKLDNVINDQRQVIYGLRDSLLESDNILSLLMKHMKSVPDYLIEKYCKEDAVVEDWDIATLKNRLESILFLTKPIEFNNNFESNQDVKEIVRPLLNDHMENLQVYTDNEQIQKSIKGLAISIIDKNWIMHLDTMNRLKEGVGMRHYQQEDPIQLYQKEGLELFTIMYNQIEFDLSFQVTNVIRSFHNKKSVGRLDHPRQA
ncbi:accessory Sec system translocase SecA2 [Aquibacillus salsiterrae]|uniref:Protein translocase subunit SecA n=1 Tax=Aquibacillus salsiterrae TaxID=2950439 RepID=A0A9X3WBG6_9BACI|nr:accessory Sec system translocase SecA2 [Aquibacillus salsiterrae]MDC3416112.1 accessory Sec system translocase SecA2 [Aquibacillus salsiterrae]